jgi:hypothetical protein
MRAPQAVSLLAQRWLIDLADLLQDLTHAIQRDLPAHPDHLLGMERNLTIFSAGVIYIQDPLVMAFAAGAGGAGNTPGKGMHSSKEPRSRSWSGGNWATSLRACLGPIV